MVKSDRVRFASLMTALAEYYGRPLSDGALEFWWADCVPYSYQQVARAVELHRGDSKRGAFMPVKADLTRFLDGSADEAAEQAWGKVINAIQQVGHYDAIAFDDGAIHRCIQDLGGWRMLCMTEADALPFRAKEFRGMYARYAERREIPEHPKMLAGTFNGSPVLYGDRERAAAVLAGRGRELGMLALTGNKPLPSIAITKGE